MSSVWSSAGVKLSVFGESHGKGIGVVLDNIPAGQPIDYEKIKAFMARRAPGNDPTATARKEADEPEILSGIHNKKTTGAPICAVIRNSDTHSSDYSQMETTARPGHADYTGYLRYKGFNDVRGSGHFSGRLTAPLVFAGAVCGQIIERMGIYVGAHLYSIMDVIDKPLNTVSITRDDILSLREKAFPVLDDRAGEKMREQILAAKKNADSVGGIIECCAVGMPAGIGSPMFDGLENTIASLIFGIPAVKGLEFGAGFGATKMFGSQNNDEFYVSEDGTILTETNYHGGILGGISSGMPISLKVALKPTSSIGVPQKTVNFVKLENQEIIVKGRHDPCVAVRAVPVVESCVNVALLSQLIEQTQLF